MGLPLHGVTPTGAVEHLIAESAAGRGGYVMTPNLDNMYALTRDPELMNRALGAELRVADGMPLLWASRIKGRPLPGRVAGSDLILSLAGAIARTGGTLFLLGGEPGTAERAGDELRRRAPGLNIAGTYCPPFGYEHDQRELEEIHDRLSVEVLPIAPTPVIARTLLPMLHRITELLLEAGRWR